jgi:muconate cycloisomerase
LSSSDRTDTFSLQPVRIRCYHFNQAFAVAFHSPQIKRFQADSVIVRIDCQDDIVGFGESAPRPYVTGEDSHSVTQLILDLFAPILCEQAINSIASIQTLLLRLEEACQRGGITAYSSALGAIDLALLDALERSNCIHPETLFAETHRDALPLSVSVPFLPLEIIRTTYPLFKDQFDFTIIKILASDDAAETYERVRLIRDLAGPNVELRLEFNGKMTFSRVQAILNRMTPFEIRAVEQPMPVGHWQELHSLRKQFNVDFVADESLITLADAKALITHQDYTIFNIKVSKCGGLLRSQQIAKLAQKHGIPCQVGTHVGESRILGRAGRRLARSLPNFDCYGGGSEVLFSYLFEQGEPAAENQWPPPAHNDHLKVSDCENLVSQPALLGDTASSTHPSIDQT